MLQLWSDVGQLLRIERFSFELLYGYVTFDMILTIFPDLEARHAEIQSLYTLSYLSNFFALRFLLRYNADCFEHKA